MDNGSNGSGDGDEISAQNPLCLSCEWASGTWDARHVVNGNAVYELPFGRGKQMLNQGVTSVIAGNWKLTTTALARPGFPSMCSSAEQLHLAPYGNSGTLRPATWLRAFLLLHKRQDNRTLDQSLPLFAAPAAGTFGNASRSSSLGLGTWQIDTGVTKTLRTQEERALVEFRCGILQHLQSPTVRPAASHLQSFQHRRLRQHH